MSPCLSQEHLQTILDEMIFLVEHSFEINIEEIYGSTSFWVPTPDDEIEELELFGIIELGDEPTTFERIVHLTHETGHVLYHMDELFRYTKDIMFNEALAWYLGYHFMAEHGYVIDMSEYEKEIKHALKLYRWSENAGDVK